MEDESHEFGCKVEVYARRYSEEQRAQAVRLVFKLREELGTDHGTVKRVADQLGYGVESVRSWVHQAEIDGGLRAGTSSGDAPDQGVGAGEPGAAPGERQFTSIRYSERVTELGGVPSVGTVADSYDNALAEAVNGL